MSAQEGSPAAASKVLLSFQSMVQGQLAKIKSDLQAGKAFPQLPIVKDLQAFQVQDCLRRGAPPMLSWTA